MKFKEINKQAKVIRSKELIIFLKFMIIFFALFLISDVYTFTSSLLQNPHRTVVARVVMTNGAERWNYDTAVTPPHANSISFSPGETVAPFFQGYYHHYDGAQSLGYPLTDAFPIQQGWVQFFQNGALLCPFKYGLPAKASSTIIYDMASAGTKDALTGIIRIPLLQALLTAGSQVPIGGQDSTITYVDLRKATAPDFVQPMLATNQATFLSSFNMQDVMIPIGYRSQTHIGHRIPLTFWNYMNRSTISPHGWQTDFAAPLTEALSFTVNHNGRPHHILAQAFLQDGLIFDQDASDNLIPPVIQRLPTGLDYLKTFNLPAIILEKDHLAWSQQETTLMAQPTLNQARAHIGPQFPLTLLGDTVWEEGRLWYHVQWSSPKGVSAGWVLSSSVTFDAPKNGSGWASFDVLSPDLAHYLTTVGPNISVSVYDLSRQRFYTYNTARQFISASSIKVPIMLAFFDKLEQQKREPAAYEMALLTSMIEHSDNDAASELYYHSIGGAPGLIAFLQKNGIHNFMIDPDAWGYSQISAQAMVDLLTLVATGDILTPYHRTLALGLMSHVETDQRFGVGDTAPADAIVFMKNGWVIGPDHLWVVNSSGIITCHHETYIVAVYTQAQPSLDVGQTTIRRVCKSISTLLSW